MLFLWISSPPLQTFLFWLRVLLVCFACFLNIYLSEICSLLCVASYFVPCYICEIYSHYMWDSGLFIFIIVQQSIEWICHNYLFPLVLIGEGNGTPLQYSCQENPMDGGAWWAAIHGVASTNQDSAEVNKRSGRDGRLQSRGPSDFHLAAETQHSPNEFNVATNQ